ncbi:MAG TPA: hypothetical protein VFW09_12865 [Solirubrobacteraceae bacterium]|nr:hypothetical protein [Solirubrobacteraceae bacterium]
MNRNVPEVGRSRRPNSSARGLQAGGRRFDPGWLQMSNLAHRIGVMYMGKLVEVGGGDDIYRQPAHHYKAGLIAAIPQPDPSRRNRGRVAMQGELPNPRRPLARVPLPNSLLGRPRASAPSRSRCSKR